MVAGRQHHRRTVIPSRGATRDDGVSGRNEAQALEPELGAVGELGSVEDAPERVLQQPG
jgi:hypothetical protein